MFCNFIIIRIPKNNIHHTPFYNVDYNKLAGNHNAFVSMNGKQIYNFMAVKNGMANFVSEHTDVIQIDTENNIITIIFDNIYIEL